MNVVTRTSYQREQAFRAAIDADARREWQREVDRNRAEEDEHERILNESLTPTRGRALSASEDERVRIAEDGEIFAAMQRHDRLIETGVEW